MSHSSSRHFTVRQWSSCNFSLRFCELPGCYTNQLSVSACISDGKFKYSHILLVQFKLTLKWWNDCSSWLQFIRSLLSLLLYHTMSPTPILDLFSMELFQLTNTHTQTHRERLRDHHWRFDQRQREITREVHNTPFAQNTVLNTLWPDCPLLIHYSATEIINKYDSPDGLQANQTAQQRAHCITVNPWLLPGFQKANRSAGMIDNQ